MLSAHFFVSCFALLCCVPILVTSVEVASSSTAGLMVKYSNCTDKAFCLSGCQSATVPSDQCLSFASNKSEIISCDPVISVCGDLSYFTDPQCSNLWFTNAFICGVCSDNGNGKYSKVNCDSEHGTEFMAIYQCDSGNNNKCETSQCTNPWNVTKGVCIPTQVQQHHLNLFAAQEVTSSRSHLLSEKKKHKKQQQQEAPKIGQTAYAWYTGATTCTSVKVTQWESNGKCSGQPTQIAVFPDKSCVHGATLQCLYN